MKTQTAGLAKVFGGSLDEYFEATGEKIPLVIESCIKYINTYGMKHQGIFRIGGAHVSAEVYPQHENKYIFSRLISTSTRRSLRRAVTPSPPWSTGTTSTP